MSEDPNSTTTFCGFVAIMGRPNVGKSSLMNRLLGEKLSITSKKPQTTRHRILGVKTLGDVQIIYVDTPGLHEKAHHAMNRYMNKAARQALKDVDVILFVIEELKWKEEDAWILDLLSKVSRPIILVVNKIDLIPDKEALLPHIKTLSEICPFHDIIPISAKKGTNIEELENIISKLLPENPHFFPEDQITDRDLGFRIAELIREKVIRFLGQELPYTTTVQIESFKREEKKRGKQKMEAEIEGKVEKVTPESVESIAHIHAIIWVEREGQKPIVIGKNGERLKEIGIKARLDLEKLLNCKVNLKLWVKVKGGWSDDVRALTDFGLIDSE